MFPCIPITVLDVKPLPASSLPLPQPRLLLLESFVFVLFVAGLKGCRYTRRRHYFLPPLHQLKTVCLAKEERREEERREEERRERLEELNFT